MSHFSVALVYTSLSATDIPTKSTPPTPIPLSLDHETSASLLVPPPSSQFANSVKQCNDSQWWKKQIYRLPPPWMSSSPSYSAGAMACVSSARAHLLRVPAERMLVTNEASTSKGIRNCFLPSHHPSLWAVCLASCLRCRHESDLFNAAEEFARASYLWYLT